MKIHQLGNITHTFINKNYHGLLRAGTFPGDFSL